MMRKLRDEGCTLQDIGDVFGVTRERARQIVVGLRVHPCQCPDCNEKRWFEVGDGERLTVQEKFNKRVLGGLRD